MTTLKEQLDGPEALMTVEAVATMYGVSEKTIRRWIREGHLPCRFVGPAKRIRIERKDALALKHDG